MVRVYQLDFQKTYFDNIPIYYQFVGEEEYRKETRRLQNLM